MRHGDVATDPRRVAATPFLIQHRHLTGLDRYCAGGDKCQGDSSPLELLYSVTVPLQQGSVTWKLPPLPLGSRCVRLEVAGQIVMLALPRKFTGSKP